MAVYVANLQINQGADFSQIFNLANTQGDTSFNLTGYAVEAKMKKHAAAAASTATHSHALLKMLLMEQSRLLLS